MKTIARPDYESVSLETGLRWNQSNAVQYSEKLDGCRNEIRIGQSVIVGELMQDGRFFAFDLPIFQGNDIRRESRRARLAMLDTFNLLRPESDTNGGELLRRVLARGGEGICAADWESPFNATVWRCKRIETFDCLVTAKDVSRSTIQLSLDGTDAGWCPARSAFWKIQLGDVVEVAAYRRNASGKLRESRFIRLRPDRQSIS